MTGVSATFVTAPGLGDGVHAGVHPLAYRPPVHPTKTMFQTPPTHRPTLFNEAQVAKESIDDLLEQSKNLPIKN